MPPEIDDQITNNNDVDVDQLLNDVESEGSGGGVITDAPPAPAAPVDEFEFTVGGKSIKANREKMIKWAQMGYDAPTRIGSLTKEIESWKQKGSRFDELESKYGEIDKFVREKPEFWDHVTQSWKQKDQLLNDQSNPLATTVQQLQQTVQGLLGKVTTYEQQQQQVRTAREDEAYQQEFAGITTKYPQVDFKTPDETGKTLEYKVIEYALEKGIKEFTPAFRAFYHDELVKLEAEKAKESVVKEKQKNTRLGILGKTDTPTKRSSDDVKGKSYADITRQIIDELNLS